MDSLNIFKMPAMSRNKPNRYRDTVKPNWYKSWNDEVLADLLLLRPWSRLCTERGYTEAQKLQATSLGLRGGYFLAKGSTGITGS
jgi:hypothetical protein